MTGEATSLVRTSTCSPADSVPVESRYANQMERLTRLPACLALVALLPTATLAAPKAECFWQGLPIATRDNFIVAYQRGGQQAASRVDLTPDLQTVSICAGEFPTDPEEGKRLGAQVGALIASISAEKASALRLAELGYSPGKLDDAWSGLGPAKRAVLRAAGDDILKPNTGPSPELLAVAREASLAAGMPKDSDRATVIIFGDYFFARAIREAWEAR